MTGRQCAACSPGSFFGLLLRSGGAGDFFFKTRWLLAYSNIRPARSQHTHAPRLTSRWARPSPRCCCCPVVSASQRCLLLPSRDGTVDGSFHHWFLVTQRPHLASARPQHADAEVCHCNATSVCSLAWPSDACRSSAILAGSPECAHMPHSSPSDRPPSLSSLTMPLPAADRFYTASFSLRPHQCLRYDWPVQPSDTSGAVAALLATSWCCRASETSLNRDRRPSLCSMSNRIRVCA